VSKKQQAVEIQDLPRAQEALSAEEAGDARGGFFGALLSNAGRLAKAVDPVVGSSYTGGDLAGDLSAAGGGAS
jgi:hypothetical protein